jgi:hemin uptake protein HemP
MKMAMSTLQSAPHAWASDRSAAEPATDGVEVPQLSSKGLLGAAGEAVIEHDGHLYRLRRTSRGGLVLTK